MLNKYLLSECIYYPHFTDKETKTEKDEIISFVLSH